MYRTSWVFEQSLYNQQVFFHQNNNPLLNDPRLFLELKIVIKPKLTENLYVKQDCLFSI
jgi:hypothetical protein